jgi:soluble P-type ATPase
MFQRKKPKTGITLQIPGFGDRHIQRLLADYDGTLSCRGEAADDVKQRLTELAVALDIHILTGDKKAKRDDCFGKLPVKIHILSSDDQDVQKREYLNEYLKQFNPAGVTVIGNGNNDRLLMEAAKSGGGLCFAVLNGEGCSIEVLTHAHLLVRNVTEALDLLLNPDLCAATLRY